MQLKYTKTPQRSFIVEFKSGRRQPKTQTNSIWGDTDLKAFAREVEETVPHLFNSKEERTTPSPGEASFTDPNPGSAAEVPGDGRTARAAIPVGEDTGVDEPKRDKATSPAVKIVELDQKSQPTSQPRSRSRQTPGKPAKRAAANVVAHISNSEQEDQSDRANTAEHRISSDELAVLDAENKRLKRLMAEHLRAENSKLKKMLERFRVT